MLKTTFILLTLVFNGAAVIMGAQTLNYGSTVLDSLGCNGLNTYSFVGNAGDNVLVEVAETADFGGVCNNVAQCGFTQHIRITDGSGSVISSVDSPPANNGCSNQFRTQDGPFVLPQAGTYTISVSGSPGRGAYTLYLQRTNNPGNTTTLQLGAQRLVPLQTAGSVQAFVISANQNASVDIEMLPQTGNLVPMLALYGPDGTPVALPAGGSIKATLTQTGNYTLLAFSAGAQTGTYQLTLMPLVSTAQVTAALAHFAWGATWTTGMFVVNRGNQPAQFSVAFYDDNGNPIALTFGTAAANIINGTIPSYGSSYFEASNTQGPLNAGWGKIVADQAIAVQSLFRNNANGIYYEAAVPSSLGSKEFVIPFDATIFAETNTPLYTGLAIANLDSQNSANITCTARNSLGNVIPNAVLVPSLGPLGHWSEYLFPVLTGQHGTIDCVSSTSVAAIALRFIGTNAFSSLPVITK